jgi:DNA invertase Pin-like site-specific DNA recombinase
MERVHERGATVKALDRQFLDLSTTIGKGILAFLSALAQNERERILKRSKDGLKHAKARGVHCGRPLALNDYQREEAARRLAEGERTVGCQVARGEPCHRGEVEGRLRAHSIVWNTPAS